MQEGVFDEVPQLVERFVIGPLMFPVVARRDHGLHPLLVRLLDDGIAVVATIRQQMLRRDSLNQARSLCAISPGTLRNNNSDRHTMRIHGQM